MPSNIKAIIPAAGFGTRFLPLTKAQPKEMLPVVNKPTIQWVVEEAVNAGISEIGIITNNNKEAIENHFTSAKFLEDFLESKGKISELDEVKKINKLANIEFIVQEEQKGLGHAILCAEDFIGDSAFAVLLGDTICTGEPNCTKKLLDIYEKRRKSVFAVEKIALEDTERYGIVSGTELSEGFMQVSELVEKPKPAVSPSQLGILGRYVFNSEILKYQKEVKRGAGGEIQLTDAMQLLAQNSEIYSWTFDGKRYDIGTMKDWFRSHIELSYISDFSSELKDIMENL